MRIEPPMSEPVAIGEVPEPPGSRRAAGRAAGGEFRVPRIARDAPEPGVGVGGAGEFRRRGARMHDAARLQDALVVGRGDVGHEVLVDQRAVGGRLALDPALVLDRDRQAFERADAPAPPLAYFASALRAAASASSKWVKVKAFTFLFDLLGARDHRLHQLDRRQLLRTEQRQRFGRAQVAQVDIAHGIPPQRNCMQQEKDPGGRRPPGLRG